MSHQQSNSVIALVGRHSILFLINIYSLAPDNACTHLTFLLKDLGTKLTCIPLLNVRGCVPGPQTLHGQKGQGSTLCACWGGDNLNQFLGERVKCLLNTGFKI